VRLLRINRPEARNALNMEVRHELSRNIEEFGADADVRCVILAGGEKSFAAGADIKERASMDVIAKMGSDVQKQRMSRIIVDCPKPVIAAVRGYCLGGGFEIAMMCDIIVAGESAQFGLPELKLGVIPVSGGTQRLARVTGKHKALYHILTARFFSAQQALACGVASEVVADDQVEAAAIRVAGEIAALAPLAVQQAKEVLMKGMDAPLDVGIALEARGSQLLYATEDQKEGMSAFIDKRKPVFKGR
jgi:enoyl-CoA hydratase/carnithine racemase